MIGNGFSIDRKRVAAYVWVSTDGEEQVLLSECYARQKKLRLGDLIFFRMKIMDNSGISPM